MVCENIDVTKIIIQKKPISSIILKEKEESYFYNAKEWSLNNSKILMIDNINSIISEKIITSEKPDIIFVFGSSLLKENIFSIPNIGCINIHTGLVQHYRGVDSTFWAMYDERPDLIGSTLHFINNTIDAGKVLAQKKLTDISITDSLEDLFIKNCICGFELLRENINNFKNKEIKTIKLEKKGKLYQLKDKTDDKVKDLENRLYKVLNKYYD
jgi:methionyl-tRNA formyltransferase